MDETDLVSITRTTIVVIDDSADHRMLLAIGLRQQGAGIVVAEADSAVTALGQVGEHQPDVIILDNRLPDTNGSDLAPALRQASPNSRIILCTAAPEGLQDLVRDGIVDALVGKGSATEVADSVRQVTLTP